MEALEQKYLESDAKQCDRFFKIKLFTPWILLFFWICFISTGYSQNTFNRIEVKVLDTISMTPVEAVLITYSFTENNKKSTKYFHTNEHGMGLMLLPKAFSGQVQVSCSHLSYVQKSVTKNIADISDSKWTILIDQRLKELDEVVIKSYRLGIHDTVHVKFDTSLLAGTNNIIEQLKNDKRFIVNSNDILFKGNTITKVIVDDVDVTGDNYIGLVEQAKIKTFESMDVIQNYHENSLNQGFEKPETAIRLNTRDRRKYSTSLSIEGEVSQIRINEAKLSNYIIGPKAKFFNSVSYGQNSNRLFRPYNYDNNSGNIEKLKTYRVNIDRPSINIPMDNIHKTEVLVNAGIPITKNILNRTSLNLLNQTDFQANELSASLSLSGDYYKYNQHDSIETATNYYFIENETKFNKNKTFVNLTGHLLIPADNYSSLQSIRGAIEETKKDEFRMNQSTKTDLSLVIANLITDKLLLEYQSNARFVNFNESYINISERALEVFNSNGPITDWIKTQSFYWDNFATLKIKLRKKNTLKLKFGILNENRIQDLNRKIAFAISDSISKSSGHLRHTDIYFSLPIGNTNLSKTLRYEFLPKINYVNYFYKNAISTIESDELLYDLSAKIILQPNSRLKLTAAASKIKQLISSDDFKPFGYNDGSFLIFQTIIGKPIESFLRYYLDFGILNKPKSLDFNLKVKHEYYFDKKGLITQRGVAQGTSNLSFFSGQRTESEGKITYNFESNRFKINLYSKIQYFNKSFSLNEEQINSKALSNLRMVNLDFRTRHFTFIYSFSFFNLNNKLSNGSTFTNRQFNNKMIVRHITNDKKWNTSITCENINWSETNRQFTSINFFVDYGFTKALHFGLFGYNLLGNKSVNLVSNFEYGQNIFSYKIVPMQIGIHFKWDIY